MQQWLHACCGAARCPVSPVFAARPSRLGPSNYLKRLKAIDEEMKSLDKRNTDGSAPRKCMGEDAKEWTPPSFPGSGAFKMYFSCVEDRSASLQIYFGKRDSYW